MLAFSNYHSTQSAAGADGNVISLASNWVLPRVRFWPAEGTRGEVKGSPKLFQFIQRGWIFVLNLIAINPIVVEKFLSTPEI